MPLPNFLCVGAQKAGTTTLHYILKQHYDIFLPDLKEAHFFDMDERYNKGLKWYEKTFFYNYKDQRRIGTITPEYMYFEKVPERIYKHLGGDIKLIFMLRNPVDRAYSHYLMSYRRGYETETFEKAIELEKERIKIDEFHKNHFSYIDRGFYAKQIKRYLKFFPKKNMFFIIFETDFLKNKENTIKSLLEFLEVDTNVTLNLNIRSNPASMPRFKIIRDLIYKPNRIKKLGKYLIPNEKWRKKLIMILDNVNQKQVSPPKLSNDFKSDLLFRYFIDDIKELEIILERKLNVWYK